MSSAGELKLPPVPDPAPVEGPPMGFNIAQSEVTTMVGVGEDTGRRFVVLRIEHAAGVGVHFMSPEHAVALARDLVAQARQLVTGIQVADPSVLSKLPPVGNGA